MKKEEVRSRIIGFFLSRKKREREKALSVCLGGYEGVGYEINKRMIEKEEELRKELESSSNEELMEKIILFFLENLEEKEKEVEQKILQLQQELKKLKKELQEKSEGPLTGLQKKINIFLKR